MKNSLFGILLSVSVTKEIFFILPCIGIHFFGEFHGQWCTYGDGQADSRPLQHRIVCVLEHSNDYKSFTEKGDLRYAVVY